MKALDCGQFYAMSICHLDQEHTIKLKGIPKEYMDLFDKEYFVHGIVDREPHFRYLSKCLWMNQCITI